MIILRQKTFSYYRDLQQLSGTGNPIRNFFRSPERIKKVRSLNEKSLNQWEKVAKEYKPGTPRRDTADRELIKRLKELKLAEEKISRTPWKL